MSKRESTDLDSIKANPFKRLLAFIVDLLFLGLIGILISIPLGSFFFTLGQHGWWIGFLIALLYFSISETSKTKGQTLGGKLLGLSVVTTEGKYLQAKESLIRNFLLLIIYFNSSVGALIPLSDALLTTIFGIILFSYIGTFIVFILFHPQHRGIHDLVTGSVVVKKKNFDAYVENNKLHITNQLIDNKKAMIISTAISILVLIGGIVISVINPLKDTFFSNLLAIHNVINKDQGVQDSSVMLNTFIDPEGHSTKSLIITVSVDRNTFTDNNKLNNLDSLVKKQAVTLYPQINLVDQVQVVFNSGYTIGIWTFNENANGTPIKPQSL